MTSAVTWIPPAGCSLPPGLQRLPRRGVDVLVAPDDRVALGDGLPVPGHDDLRRGRGDLERGGELEGRLGAELLADGDAGQRIAAATAVGGPSGVGGAAAVRAVIGAGGEADGGGGGEGGGQQRAAADQVRAFRVGGPVAGTAPGYGAEDERSRSVAEGSVGTCSGEGHRIRRSGGALGADLLEERVDHAAARWRRGPGSGSASRRAGSGAAWSSPRRGRPRGPGRR